MTDETHRPDVHPDLDTLADLQEGLLPPGPAAAVSSHLTDCPACRADLAALEALPDRLAAAAPVGAMPDDVVARLEEALSGPGAASGATITVLPRSDSPRRRDNRVLQAAAAAVLVLAATAVGVSALQDRDIDRTAASDAAGERANDTGLTGSVPVLSTGTNYTQESVAAAVPRLLRGDGPQLRLDSAPEAAAGDATEDKDRDDVTRLGTGAALSGCVSALTDDPDTPDVELPTPLVVDIATFAGQPATVIVVPTPDEADQLDVYVVGSDCAPADANLLHFARVPRP